MSNYQAIYSLASPGMIATGLLTGLTFGFLLQKGGVTRYQVILGQFLFRDFTVLKVMLTAILVGAIGIWGLRSAGVDVGLHIKSAALAANVVGGLIFGVGMAVLGYCPGTGAAALGDGSRHAIPGLLGMLVGGAAFAVAFPFLQDNVMKWLDITIEGTDKITFADASGLSPWWFIAALAIVAVAVFFVIERFAPRRPSADVSPA